MLQLQRQLRGLPLQDNTLGNNKDNVKFVSFPPFLSPFFPISLLSHSLSLSLFQLRPQMPLEQKDVLSDVAVWRCFLSAIA